MILCYSWGLSRDALVKTEIELNEKEVEVDLDADQDLGDLLVNIGNNGF